MIILQKMTPDQLISALKYVKRKYEDGSSMNDLPAWILDLNIVIYYPRNGEQCSTICMPLPKATNEDITLLRRKGYTIRNAPNGGNGAPVLEIQALPHD